MRQRSSTASDGRRSPVAVYDTQSASSFRSAAASLVAVTPTRRPSPHSSPASRPTLSCPCTQRPTSSSPGWLMIPRSASLPTLPVLHWMTRWGMRLRAPAGIAASSIGPRPARRGGLYPKARRGHPGHMRTSLLLLAALLLPVVRPAVGAEEAAPAEAAFAGGCFWCMQPPFEALDGVISVTAGYAGGTTQNPTYDEVSAGGTGHAESIEVVYDPTKIGYDKLLDVFWHNVDPTDAR